MTSLSDRKPLLAHLLLAGVVAVWGATFPLVKVALADVSPLLFNLLRMMLASVALACLNRRELRNLSRKSVTLGLIAGAFLGAGYQFQTTGLARTSPAKSAFITGLMVIFVALAGVFPPFRPRSRSSPRAVVLGALLSFSGLVLLTTSQSSSWSELCSSINLGDVLTLFCAAAFAGHLLTLSKVESETSAGALATLQVSFASVLMLLTLHLNGPVHIHVSLRFWIALLVTSLLATAAAFTVQSWAQQHISAPHAAALLTLEPVFALITSVILFHERLTSRISGGAALIFLGILVLEQFGSPTSTDPVLGAAPTLPGSQ